MKLTIIYDNEAYTDNLKSDWGFSALLETEDGPKILFDTGTEGEILLSNMEELGIDPDSIDEIFISHPHFDHIGGLDEFLSENRKIDLYVPANFEAPKVGGEVVKIREPQKIHEKIFSTGLLEGIEQSLLVETEHGLAIVAGCSHPSMKKIIDSASQFGEPYAIIGGLHGTGPEPLKGLEMICATHCTKMKDEIRKNYPNQYIEGEAGRVIEL